MAKDGRKRIRRRDQAERVRMRGGGRAAAADEWPEPGREARRSENVDENPPRAKPERIEREFRTVESGKAHR
jgi:hypothetical protein